MQGGGSTQFSAVPLNLCGSSETPVQYVVTGAWSAAAAAEAAKYARVQKLAGGTGPAKKDFSSLPDLQELRSNLDPNAAFLYTCANETVHGVEWPAGALEEMFEPAAPAAVAAGADGAAPAAAAAAAAPVLVSDMSSSFMSRPVDVSRYGLIYAGAQKNVGPAGVTLVIVRDDLISGSGGSSSARAPFQPSTPLMLQYKTLADKDSMYNTPACYAIYVTGLVFKWVLQQGGLEGMAARNAAKAQLLYDAIDQSQGFYRAFVANPAHRSRMNVVFTVTESGAADSSKRDDRLNDLFVQQAEAASLVGLAGHRSVGGLRASLYNAVSLEATQALVQFMKEFQHKHGNKE